MKYKIQDSFNGNIWFTADTHLGHEKILGYCDRPFDTIKEMNETIINNWNKVVKDKDIVFHLGDFVFGSPDLYLPFLKGKIILVKGSHDSKYSSKVKEMFFGIYDIIDLIIKKENLAITLCHYPMLSWRSSFYGSYHLFGHEHSSYLDFFQGRRMYNVGVDTNNFTPVSLENIKEIFNKEINNNE